MAQNTKTIRITEAVFIDGELADVGEEGPVEEGLANRLIGANKAIEVKEKTKKSDKSAE